MRLLLQRELMENAKWQSPWAKPMMKMVKQREWVYFNQHSFIGNAIAGKEVSGGVSVCCAAQRELSKDCDVANNL